MSTIRDPAACRLLRLRCSGAHLNMREGVASEPGPQLRPPGRWKATAEKHRGLLAQVMPGIPSGLYLQAFPVQLELDGRKR